MEQTKLCSTPVYRNRKRETVMKYNCRRSKLNRRSFVVLLYRRTGEGKHLLSIVVEEGKWNRRCHVVLLYGGTEEGKQL